MAVTINTLGTNSRQIVISGETSATNIINAVNTSLTALGWTLIDTVTSGSRGLLTTKVYSAPNADSVTTKYMIIRYDLPRQYWFVSCCEAFNTTTHVATNESWYGGRNILLPLQYSNCILYVFATARYACFMGTVRSEPSAWQGVFEFERSAAEDISANSVPCFGWTSSLTIGEPYGNFVTPVFGSTPGAGGNSNSAGPVAAGFAPPRTASGVTGISAANTFVVMTGLGEYPIQKSFMTADWSSGGITQTINSHCGMLGAFGENMSTYVWDVNSSVISNLKLAGYTQFYPTGKIFGLKITGKLGNPLDTTIIPVDANLFYDPVGNNTTHCLLGIHGGYKDKLTSIGSNRLSPNVYNSGTALGNIYQTVLVSGRFIYFTTSTGFHKFDLITLGYIYNVLPAGAYAAVKFDGENTLYITNATTTIFKLNLTNDTYTTLTVGATVSGIALDDDNLYAVTNNTSGTTVTVYKISLSTFTQTASWALTIVTGNYATHMTTGNYDGYLYVASYAVAARTNCRVHRVLTSDGTNSFLQNSLSNTWFAVSGGQTSFFDGVDWYIFSTSNQPSNTVALGFNRLRLSNMTWIVVDAGLSVAGSIYVNSTFNLNIPATLGCMESPAFAGTFMVFWVGLQHAVKLPLSDPRVPIMNAVPADYNNVANGFDNVNINNLGQPVTDHCSYYTFSTTYVIRYVGAFRNYNFNGVQTANLLIAQ